MNQPPGRFRCHEDTARATKHPAEPSATQKHRRNPADTNPQLDPAAGSARTTAMETFQIEMLDVTLLKPAAYNPRKRLRPGDKTYEDIKRAIGQFGLVQNLIWNKRSGNLVAGHQRLNVGKREFGWKTAPCIVVDLDQAAEKALNILMNKVGEGNWSTTKLADLLAELAAIPTMDLTDLGFDESELEALLKKPSPKTNRDPESAPSPPKNPRTKPGDVYHIISADGHPEHRLICGSSQDRETWEKLLSGVRPAMAFTDPPYGVAYQSKAKSGKMALTSIQNDELQRLQLEAFLLPAFRLAHEFSAPSAALYCFFATREHIAFETALRKAEWEPTQELIWAKQMNLGRSNYHWAHEPCFYGHKTGQQNRWYGDRCQTTLWQDDRPDFLSMNKADLVALLTEIADATTVWDEKRDPPSSYIHPCLPTGELVFAAGRWQPIETVKAGQTTPYGSIAETTSHTAHHIVTITLDDGTRCKATGNHPFLIARGNQVFWMEARHIQPGDETLTLVNELDTQKPCQDGKTASQQPDPSPPKDTDESTTRERNASECSTSSFGSASTDQSPKECSCTTGTKSKATILLITSSLSVPLTTSGFTVVAERPQTANGKNHARPAESLNQPPRNSGIFPEDGSTAASVESASATARSKSERFELRKVGSVNHEDTPTTVHNLTIDGIPAFDTLIGVSHNTQKPTSLARRAMRHSTLPRDSTIDFYAGSGSTMIAGQLQGRATYSIELEPGFCDAIIQRYVETFAECLLFRNGEEIDPATFRLT